MSKTKVFGIGFHRTGTTSLQTALEELGYKVIGMRKEDWLAFEENRMDEIRTVVNAHDGFRDMPWPLLYQWLYENWPDAKFILTYRDSASWAASCSGNYKQRPYRMFRKIYQTEVFKGNEERCIEIYEQHIQEVRAYFSDKPDQFLELDITKVRDWKQLCEFLEEPIPSRDFPHANNRPKSLTQKIYLRLLRYIAPQRYKSLVRDK